MKLPFGKPERAHVDVDTLSAYLDHQIAPAERARVEGHLADCIACRDELDGLRRTVTLLQTLPRVPVPRAFTLSEAQVGIRRPEPRPAWVSWTRGLAAVTAIALVAVVAVSLLNRPSWQPSATVARTAPAAEAPQVAVQSVSPAESAPAEALAVQAPAPAQPTVMAKIAGEKPIAVAKTVVEAPAAAVDAVAPTVASEPAPAALAAKPATSKQRAAPTARAVAATEAPSLMAAAAAPAAPAPQGTPAVGVMALGRGAGGAAAMPTLAQPPEPTPALVQPESILPATAGFVYADEKGLWTVDAKFGIRQLVTSEGLSLPIISSDRSRVAYRVQQDDQSELWTVRWDGTDAGLLLRERDLPTSDLPAGYTERRLNDVRWLPGRAILAVTTAASPGSPDLLPKLELWHLNVESGALQRVTDMGRAYRPFYSPDGTQIALLQYGTESDPTGDLTLVNADGTDRRVVLRFPAGPTTASSDSQIAWLPAGSGLWAYVPDPSTSSDTNGTPVVGGPFNGVTLYRVPATGGEVQSAGRVDGSQVFWSPDGSRLAYTRAGKDGALELFLANADGANPQLYASLGNGGFVNWAPDGAHFIYTDDNGQTHVGTPEGAPQWLGKSISLFEPRWISSRQLLALHDTGTNWLLVTRTLNSDAVGLQPLPHEATYDTTKP
jgi:Tol biopolymer transport system component